MNKVQPEITSTVPRILPLNNFGITNKNTKTYFSSCSQLYRLAIGVSQESIIISRKRAVSKGPSSAYCVYRIR